MTHRRKWIPLLVAGLAALQMARAESPSSSDLPKHQLPASPAGNLVIGNCDGKSSVEVLGKKEGERLTETEARDVTRKLMSAWKKQHPGVAWRMVSEETPAPKDVVTAAGTRAQGTREQEGAVKEQTGTYSNYVPEDRKIWNTEQAKLVQTGKEIFHSGDLLRSKTGVSCDMCHPNAANTHPETYPKYQVQLQRVAMLRDMINWCIENPAKGEMLKDDDPRMRALEAYIINQREGVKLAPGKH